MNKKLFYLLSLLCVLSLDSAWGMKKKEKENLFSHENIPSSYGGGPWGVICDFLELDDLFVLRKVSKKFYEIVGQYCEQIGWRQLQITLKKDLFKIKNIENFKKELEPLKKLLGDEKEISIMCLNCSITDDQLGEIVKLFKDNIQSLDLEGCSRITNKGLKPLAELKNLQSLDLSHCSKITDEGLEHLTKLKKLQKLKLFGCYKITNKGLGHLAELKNLQSLDLRYNEIISYEGLEHLANLTHLRKVYIDQWYEKITDADIRKLKSVNPKIEITDRL